MVSIHAKYETRIWVEIPQFSLHIPCHAMIYIAPYLTRDHNKMLFCLSNYSAANAGEKTFYKSHILEVNESYLNLLLRGVIILHCNIVLTRSQWPRPVPSHESLLHIRFASPPSMQQKIFNKCIARSLNCYMAFIYFIQILFKFNFTRDQNFKNTLKIQKYFYNSYYYDKVLS